MNDPIKNFKPKRPKVTGITTINHQLRVEMGLGCMEYVFMKAISKMVGKKVPVTDMELWKNTGLTREEQNLCLEMLIRKGYIYPEAKKDGQPHISTRYYDFFKSYENEFENEFWRDEKFQVCWRGSKQVALKKYCELRQDYKKDYLIQQRDYYFQYLEILKKTQKFDRAKMECTRFLGPQKDFEQDWKRYIEEEENAYKQKQAARRETGVPAAASVVTKAERLRKYED